jgi:AAT family amino acid transporter
VFSFLIIAGTISTANSGLYATIRTLHALCVKGMGPKILTYVNKKGIPSYASLATMGAVWVLLVFSCFVPSSKLYANLLATSGFTGTVCWISICWAQLRFRKSLHHSGVQLTYKVPFFPYTSYLSIWIQIATLVLVLIDHNLRSAFYFGVPALVIPILWYKKFRAA